MKITKLDRRHAGFNHWKYHISMPYHGQIIVNKMKFLEMRVWCWDTWGPSKELDEYTASDIFDGINCSNEYWCWLSDKHGRRRIYLRDDPELEVFVLRWS